MKTYQLPQSVTRGLSKEKQELVKESFTASRTFMNYFLETLEKKVDTEVKSSESRSNYSEKDWALYQADSMGYRRALRDTLNMFKEINND